MKKQITFLVMVLFFSTLSYGQKELEFYIKMYKTADALKASGQIGAIDTISLIKQIKRLDKKHPSDFFKASGEFLAKSKFNEAAFMYYLGVMRFRFYNSANPDYEPSGDGALLGALESVIGEPIKMYLRTDIDNYISLVRRSVSYYTNHDFKFFSKNKNIEKFNEQIKSYNDLILELETNKEIYKEQWLTERKTLEENIAKIMDESKKRGVKTKKQ